MALISQQTKQSFGSTNSLSLSSHTWNQSQRELDQSLLTQKIFLPPDSTPAPLQHIAPTVVTKVTAALNVLLHQNTTKPQQQLQKYGKLNQKQHQPPLKLPQPLLHLWIIQP